MLGFPFLLPTPLPPISSLIHVFWQAQNAFQSLESCSPSSDCFLPQFLFMWVWKYVAHWHPTLFLVSPILHVPCWLMFIFLLHYSFLLRYCNIFNTECLKEWALIRRRNLWTEEEPSHQATLMMKKMRSLRWRLSDWYLEDLIQKVQCTIKPRVYF